MSGTWVWLFAAAALLMAGAAQATTTDPRLDTVASRIAERPVSVLCYGPGEPGGPADSGAWGYVYLVGDPVEHMDPDVCAGALAIASGDVSVPLWKRALGALVLAHESFHLRRSLSDRGNEAATECRAVRHFRYVVQFLGGSAQLATDLLAYALALHWRTAAKVPAYYRPGCGEPNWWKP